MKKQGVRDSPGDTPEEQGHDKGPCGDLKAMLETDL